MHIPPIIGMHASHTTLKKINKDLQRIEMSYRVEKECYQRYGHPYYVTNNDRETRYQHFLATFHEDRGELWYKKFLMYLDLT